MLFAVPPYLQEMSCHSFHNAYADEATLMRSLHQLPGDFQHPSIERSTNPFVSRMDGDTYSS